MDCDRTGLVAEERISAVTFDAFGTLLYLDRPFQRLARALEKAGFPLAEDKARDAFLREAAYYREHHLEGADVDSLAALRHRCALALFSRLEEPGRPARLPRETQLRILMDSIRFGVYGDVPGILAWCRKRGIATGVISNWDCSLPDLLRELIRGHTFQALTVSACEGITKSDPTLYLRAARALGLSPSSILHVGNEREDDFFRAREAGFRALLLDRDGREPRPGEGRIRSLSQLEDVLRFHIRLDQEGDPGP